MTCDASHIQVLRDADGAPLADIRTPADNQRAADTITETLRTLTADPDAALHRGAGGGLPGRIRTTLQRKSRVNSTLEEARAAPWRRPI